MTAVPWEVDPACQAPQGAEGGFFVIAGGYRGYAKPRKRHNADPLQRPVAALEKIASDLAYVLQLPVPPVTVFERAEAPAGEARHHAISAVPFENFLSWRKTLEQPALASRVRVFTPPVMSAMMVFDTWLHALDRCNNPENLLVAPGMIEDREMPGLAFIDYAGSMQETWRSWAYSTPYVAPVYDGKTVFDPGIAGAMAAVIEGFPGEAIDAIVGRIPDGFMSETHKRVVVEGLTFRRDHLRGILSAKYAGVF